MCHFTQQRTQPDDRWVTVLILVPLQHLNKYRHADGARKVPKEELITSPSRDYLATATWAEALHHQFADADGLVWMSHQRDRDRSIVLLGDRVKGVLSGTRIGGPLSRNDALRQTILAAGLRRHRRVLTCRPMGD